MSSRHIFSLLLLPALLLGSGCSVSNPPSAADQADRDACTKQADAAYNAQNYEALSRTDQTGLRYSATPNHVFDAQNLGLLHQRDSAITDCVKNGTVNNSAVPGPPLPAPHIIN
jgi:hypothetical protein